MYFKYTPMYDKELIQKRAGNAKNVAFPCETIPKGIQNLQDCEPYTGHDSYLGMAYGIIDCVISKRLRCLLLLKYGKYMSISSSSLMHKPEIAGVDNIDDLPADFAYGITFSCNLRLIKLIIAEWGRTEEDEIESFIRNLEKVLIENRIALPYAEEVLDLPRCMAKFDNPIKAENIWKNRTILLQGSTNLIMLEQLLRYTKETLWTETDWTIKQIYDTDTLGERRLGFSVVMTREQAETIINQRKNHKRVEWVEICNVLKEII